MKINFFLAFAFLHSSFILAAREPKPYEIPRTQVIPIQDTASGWQYELYIKLPEKYSEQKDRQYPVIYFTDAIWHFEILSASTEYLMEHVILVGISWQLDLKSDAGAHASRYRDYSVVKSKKPEHQAKYQFGKASGHLDFIRNDVIKYVESNYRTNPDQRTYFGYSLGGVFGAYTLLKKPDTFKNYILGSPSLQGDIPYFEKLESETALKPDALNAQVFISYGALEKKLAEHTEKFITLLKTRNYPNLTLHQVVVEASNHSTAFPTTGVRSVTWLSTLERGDN